MTASSAMSLEAYLASAFTSLDDVAIAALELPRPDEAHVAWWRRHHAARGGDAASLIAALPQLQVPIADGASSSETYQRLVRQAEPAASVVSSAEAFDDPDGIVWSVVEHPAGGLPVVTARSRADFVRLVRALGGRCEPIPVGASVHALYIGGLPSPVRMRDARDAFRAEGGDPAMWPAEMARRRGLDPTAFHDRLILRHPAPYAGLAAGEVGGGLDDDGWLEASGRLRLEHEFTHHATHRLLGSYRLHVHDELLADLMGFTHALGRFDAGLLLRGLGIDDDDVIRPDARLHTYTRDLDPAALPDLIALLRRAARTVEGLAAGFVGVSDVVRLRRMLRLAGRDLAWLAGGIGPREASVWSPPIDPAFVARSLTLAERAELHRRRPEAFTPDPDRAAEIRARWRHVLARPDGDSLSDRLGDLGLEPDDLPAVAGTIDDVGLAALPQAAWMDVAAEVCAWTGPRDADGLPTAAFLDDDEPIPFEHAWIPWVEIATRRLRRACPDLDDTFSDAVLQREQRRLLENLASFGRFAAIEDLEHRRIGLYRGNDFALGMLLGSPPRTAYAATVRSMIGEAAGHWMREHAALARLLAVRTVAWARMLAEFVERLENDRGRIAEAFGGGADPGGLVELAFGAGDSHHGGRSVAVCTFERGLKVVYKPRDCGIDVAFAALVDDLAGALDPELRLQVPRTIDRGTWGWAAFVESGPCADLEALRRYHRRMGVLLAIIHALQGNDFHLENVVAAGEHPVPIDLETVSVPRMGPVEAAGLDSSARLVERSVLRTLLLPSVMGGGGHAVRNPGALRIDVGEGATRSFRRLRAVNTDFQKWVRTDGPPAGVRPESSAWIASGDTLDPTAQLAEVESGYRAGYEAIRTRIAVWIGTDSPLRRLGAERVRVLHRATNVYVRLIRQSCEAPHVGTGIDRWLALERASIVIADAADEADRRHRVALVAAEIDAMRDGDVPAFNATGDGRRVETIDIESGHAVELADTRLADSAMESALDQLGRMGPDDLGLQVRLMSDSYRNTVLSLSRAFHGGDAVPDPGSDPGSELDPIDEPPPHRERDLRGLVIAALERIAGMAIDSEDRTNWIDLDFDSQSESIRSSALDTSLYGGRGGLALLFERAYRVLGERRWLDLARRSIGSEVEAFRSGAIRDRLLRTPPGGLTERGGLLAATWAVGRHEGLGEHREVAHELAVSFSDRTIASDDAFDVIAGAAGHILLLLRLLEEAPIPGADETIGRLADHLVAAARPIDGIGWIPRGKALPLCGFGHGRAGTGLALLEAGRHLDRADLREIALEAFEAEHRLRGATPAETWPDFRGVRRNERRRAPFGAARWCLGSEGIALSRAAALRIADPPFLRDDLEFALETVRDLAVPGRDHLCCGRGGRALSQVTLRRLGVGTAAGLADDAAIDGLAASLLDHAAVRPSRLLGVGLFQGLGGPIWLGLSRLADDGSDLLLVRP